MSWKLTKKLKETHLGPLVGGKTSDSSKTSPGSENGDAQPINNPAPPFKPGILIVTLHEGQNFFEKPESQAIFNANFQNQTQNANQARPNSFSASQAAHHRHSSSLGRSSRPYSTGINAVPTIHGRYSTKYLPYALLDFEKVQVFVDAVSGTPNRPVWGGNTTQFKFDVSRAAEMNVQFYLRNPDSRPGSGRGNDVYLGMCKIHPRYEEPRTYVEDPKLSKKDREKAANAFAQQEKGLGHIGNQWIEVNSKSGELVGRVLAGASFVENRQRSLCMDDFELLKVVGKGSFGKVMQVMKKDTGRIYAMKTIRKAHIIHRSEVAHTLAERSVLTQINNPFIVPLKFSFQSPEKLYLVLAFVNGGELFHHLQKEQRFDINRARFYTAELLCALECLHGFNVIYRDLKPENILLDYTGHIALCDFGLCKLGMKDEDRTSTFCGTPEYLAPELLLSEGTGYTKAVDWWTLGVLLYEMLTGLPPFYDEDTNQMYRKILQDELAFPNDGSVPSAARDLLTRLLNRNPTKRLGANGAAEIKAHPFFSNIDWRKLLERRYEPSFRPNVLDARDVTNFDNEFTRERPCDSVGTDSALSGSMQVQFTGWSYERPVEGLGDAGGSVQDPSFPPIKE